MTQDEIKNRKAELDLQRAIASDEQEASRANYQ